MYIADYHNYRIRKVTVSTGIMTTIAGTGAASYNGDGVQATAAALYGPYGLAVDASGISLSVLICTLVTVSLLFKLGNVYIGDSGNNRVRKVIVTTNAPRNYY